MTSLQYNSIGPGRSADLADFRFDRRALKTKRCQTHVDSAGHQLLTTLAAQWKAVDEVRAASAGLCAGACCEQAVNKSISGGADDINSPGRVINVVKSAVN
uniref:Oxidoreductase n=1 Tax=Haemonchus contortus TaxID=6289 RepID=A0A7I4YWY4_HAECO